MYNHIAFIRWIKRKIPFWLRVLIIRIYVSLELFLYRTLQLKKRDFGTQKKIFVLLSTDYSNLGDHAMTYAQEKLLHARFPDHEVIEVLVGDTLKTMRSIKSSLKPNDIITLKGGGNIGVEYFREELIRREIVKYFQDNMVVMFPQTVYFPDTRFGRREFEKSMKIYNSNPLFHAFFRDTISFETASPYISNSYLTPDTVLSLGKIDISACGKFSHAVTCMRDDVEGVYSEDDKQLVLRVLHEFYSEVIQTDTIREYKIETEERENELRKIWTEIGCADILITDRLHGMIFAALLGTPCIVLNTYNHKLRAQYEWLKELNYIQICELDEDELRSKILSMRSLPVERADREYFENFFAPLYEVLDPKRLGPKGSSLQ